MAKQSARNQLMQALKEPGVCDYSTSEEMIKAHELFKLMRENNEKDRNIDALLEKKKERKTRKDAGKRRGLGQEIPEGGDNPHNSPNRI